MDYFRENVFGFGIGRGSGLRNPMVGTTKNQNAKAGMRPHKSKRCSPRDDHRQDDSGANNARS